MEKSNVIWLFHYHDHDSSKNKLNGILYSGWEKRFSLLWSRHAWKQGHAEFIKCHFTMTYTLTHFLRFAFLSFRLKIWIIEQRRVQNGVKNCMQMHSSERTGIWLWFGAHPLIPRNNIIERHNFSHMISACTSYHS